MIEQDKNQEKLISQIGKELLSKDDKKVTAALKKTEKHGSVAHIRPIMIAFMNREDGLLKDQLREVLSTLKLSEAEDVFMEALEEEEFKSIQGDILFFTWNAGFNPVDSVDLICRVALEGDYMTGVEGLTLLENMPGPLDEESLMQALIFVREFMLKYKDEGHPSYEIAIAIYGILSQHERQS
ncbi:MAG: hypothetical protein MK081_14430 [Flavobacteriales bacterium]|nr:hypothetical protein [Flavobacteriales bacterium]